MLTGSCFTVTVSNFFFSTEVRFSLRGGRVFEKGYKSSKPRVTAPKKRKTDYTLGDYENRIFGDAGSNERKSSEPGKVPNSTLLGNSLHKRLHRPRLVVESPLVSTASKRLGQRESAVPSLSTSAIVMGMGRNLISVEPCHIWMQKAQQS